MKRILYRICMGLLLLPAGAGYLLVKMGMPAWMLWVWGGLFLAVNLVPSLGNRRLMTARLRVLADGCELLRIFRLTTALGVVYTLAGYLGFFDLAGVRALLAGIGLGGVPGLKGAPWMWLIHTLVLTLVQAAVFWNGMIRLYLTSLQLGIRWRVYGALCGWIPILNLVVLHWLIQISWQEVCQENEKLLEDAGRAGEKLCAAKYPILLVHGVFFRDYRYVNYWGRIPGALTRNGARIYYGEHQSAASVPDSAAELTARIRQIVEQTGCGKVNLIAHSKGGLDCRYAVSRLGAAPYVASLTCVNTPHRGCEFADFLLSRIPQEQKDLVARAYNAALRKLGDPNPDFLAAVEDLTAEACRRRNDETPDVPGVFYQSVGSKLNRPSGGRFPLNFTYQLVRLFDGPNDGLVGEKSFPWGERYQFLTAEGRRGISHGDMIDLNRENFKGFDVREFYVELVSDLKRRGF